ncbi:MAG: hypothetical protein AAF433_06780 [Bacteroidota bacterium]
MYELNADAQAALEAIAQAVQAHEALEPYLEDGEDEQYQLIKDTFEPQIDQWFIHVSEHFPLQVEAFEKGLLDERFEGLYLPRILGYAALRGEINDYCKYARRQDHLREVLLFIAGNSNFDQLQQRIGQGLQVAFALGSDIWVTSLIEAIGNKRVRQYFQSQRKDENRTVDGRKRTLLRYSRQFRDKNFQSAVFPTTGEELTVLSRSLQDFLRYRASKGYNNQSLIAPLNDMVQNDAFAGKAEISELMALYGAYFELEAAEQEQLKASFSRERKNDPELCGDHVLALMLDLKSDHKIEFGPAEEQRLSQVIDKGIKDKLGQYFQLMDQVHSEGYVQASAQEAIQAAYDQYPGLSDFSENARQSIYGYFSRFALNLEPSDYREWFELSSKQYPVFLQLFSNEAFNQQLKDLYFKYARKLIKAYPDKRGKDYREIKKTIMAAALGWGFMTEKKLKEFFKTPRKKKPVAPSV